MTCVVMFDGCIAEPEKAVAGSFQQNHAIVEQVLLCTGWKSIGRTVPDNEMQ